jgi:REP element-mobilizing transposase RayT
MGKSKIALYLHLVWATWDRIPWITPDKERRIYRSIIAQVHKLDCKTLAINGMPDHVHLFIKYPSTISVADLVKKAKGVSSRFINQELSLDDHFRWQAGYGAFTVSRWDIDKITWYVKTQKLHHASNKINSDLEGILDPK